MAPACFKHSERARTPCVHTVAAQQCSRKWTIQTLFSSVKTALILGIHNCFSPSIGLSLLGKLSTDSESNNLEHCMTVKTVSRVGALLGRFVGLSEAAVSWSWSYGQRRYQCSFLYLGLFFSFLEEKLPLHRLSLIHGPVQYNEEFA